MGTTSTRYSAEVRARAVRMVAEHRDEYGSQWAAIESIAGKIGCMSESLAYSAEAGRVFRVKPAATNQGHPPFESIAVPQHAKSRERSFTHPDGKKKSGECFNRTCEANAF